MPNHLTLVPFVVCIFMRLAVACPQDQNVGPSGLPSKQTQELVWNQWRGSKMDGIANPTESPPTHWSTAENVLWKTKIPGEGQGTPVIWGDDLFLQTAIVSEKKLPVPDVIPAGTPNTKVNPGESITRWKTQQFAVVRVDRLSGRILWQKAVHEAMPHQGHHLKGSFAAQSSVTDGKRVFAYFGSYGLYCFDFRGNLIWKKNPQPQAMEAGLGEGSSPSLHDDFLVIVVDQETQSYIVAYDKRTGQELWKKDRDEPSNWSTPRIIQHQNQNQVIVNGIKVRSYQLESGELLWECGGHTASAIPVPAYGHGLVFNTSGWSKDKLQAIRPDKRGDLTNSSEIAWQLNRGTPYVPSPLLWGDELYLLDDQHFFSCFDAKTGQRHYKLRIPGGPNFSASPVAAKNRIYLASEEGRTFVIQRGTTPKILATNVLNDEFYASPVIVDDKIYLRGKEFLYCIGKP